MSSTRRDFLASGAAAGAAAPWLGGQLAAANAVAAGGGATNPKTLVVVRVDGGWDFLQMLVNPDHPTYTLGRPNLAIPRASLLPVSAAAPEFGWHPAMASFKGLFQAGDLAVVQNIGYPQPNGSHFTSRNKWTSGEATAQSGATTGWLTKWLAEYTGGYQIPGLALGKTTALEFAGSSTVATIEDTASLIPVFDPLTPGDNILESQLLDRMARYPRNPSAGPLTVLAAQAMAQALDDGKFIAVTGTNYTPKATYPSGTFSGYMQTIAQLITGGLQTQVYVVSTGSFDHHSNEVNAGAPASGKLASELTAVCDPVTAFLDDITLHGFGDNVIVMLYSEFGRRIGENGALGTEHGAGGIAFVAGRPVRGGLYGKYPDLSIYNQSALGQQSIIFNRDSTDFREMYATVLDRWLQVSSQNVLGAAFPNMGFL